MTVLHVSTSHSISFVPTRATWVRWSCPAVVRAAAERAILVTFRTPGRWCSRRIRLA